MVFKRLDVVSDGGGRGVEPLGRGGETAVVDHLNEGLHTGESIHPTLSQSAPIQSFCYWPYRHG